MDIVIPFAGKNQTKPVLGKFYQQFHRSKMFAKVLWEACSKPSFKMYELLILFWFQSRGWDPRELPYKISSVYIWKAPYWETGEGFQSHMKDLDFPLSLKGEWLGCCGGKLGWKEPSDPISVMLEEQGTCSGCVKIQGMGRGHAPKDLFYRKTKRLEWKWKAQENSSCHSIGI